MEALLIIAAVGLIIFFFRKRIGNGASAANRKYRSIDDRYNTDRRKRELEVDDLLGKIGENGIADLSEKDRKRLDELSKK